MEPDFWLERWRQNRIGFHNELINPWLAYYYGEMGPPPEKRAALSVFVPLCGKSRDMLWLSQNGFSVVGIEISEIAARDFFLESELQPAIEHVGEHTHYSINNIRLIRGDYFDCSAAELGPVTDVFDRAALVAMPASMRPRYAAKMADLLTAGTRILLITLTFPDGEITGPPFSVTEQEVHELYDDHFRIDKLAARDTLEMEPRLRDRGLSSLTETAFKLTRL